MIEKRVVSELLDALVAQRIILERIVQDAERDWIEVQRQEGSNSNEARNIGIILNILNDTYSYLKNTINSLLTIGNWIDKLGFESKISKKFSPEEMEEIRAKVGELVASRMAKMTEIEQE